MSQTSPSCSSPLSESVSSLPSFAPEKAAQLLRDLFAARDGAAMACALEALASFRAEGDLSSLPSRALLPPTEGSRIMPNPRSETLSPVEGLVRKVICPSGMPTPVDACLSLPLHAASPVAAIPATPARFRNSRRDILFLSSISIVFLFFQFQISLCISHPST